jgi:hypothetical protein
MIGIVWYKKGVSLFPMYLLAIYAPNITLQGSGKQKQFEDRTRPLTFTLKQHQVNRTKFGRRYLFHCRMRLGQEMVNPAGISLVYPALPETI